MTDGTAMQGSCDHRRYLQRLWGAASLSQIVFVQHLVSEEGSVEVHGSFFNQLHAVSRRSARVGINQCWV